VVHDLIEALRERGVTIFLTTHRLAEAERLCDRVAIMNTTVRLIGRPDELRERLFHKSLEIRTREPLTEPERVWSGVAGVESWQQSADGGYLLTVTDPGVAAPAAARALVAADADVLSLSPSQHSLEDVYRQLIDTDVEAQTR
jgi:ABC-2 type transport system ATP-binding protein